ncbi:MAG: MFS transporter [Acidimicrobiia bacterium]
MQRRMLVDLDAPAAVLADAAREHIDLAAIPVGPGGTGPVLERSTPDGLATTIRIELGPAAGEPAGEGGVARTTRVTVTARSDLFVPYFGWFFLPVLALHLRRQTNYAVTVLEAAAGGRPAPRPPRRSPLVPSAAFSPHQIQIVAGASALGALAAFGAALFGQNSDAIARSFHASDANLGVALAVTRLGVIVSLVAAALADRRGRRIVLVGAFAGICVANGLSALAPSLAFFTVTQTFVSAFKNAVVVVAFIVAIEDAPEGARAYAAMMLGVAAGAGYAISVILLPVTDLGSDAWRFAFAVSGLSILLIPMLWRSLPESIRYEAVAARNARRGRFREVFDRHYGRRFALLGVAAFLTNIFSAPSSSLTNRYLIDVHGFSNTGVAVLRAVTNGAPALVGIFIGGWLAETRGRRPVAVFALFLATVLQIAFFLTGGAWLWIASTGSIIAAGSATLATVTLDAELFPTEVRGTSNALLLVCYVTGSAVGLGIAGGLSDPLGGIGRSIALCGIAPLLAACFVLPRVPETAHSPLDEISPSEV